MNRNKLAIAISFALLSGCYTIPAERRASELRAKAVLPICTQDCTIEIHVTEGDDNRSGAAANEPAQTERGDDQ